MDKRTIRTLAARGPVIEDQQDNCTRMEFAT
jgi:hypothetical protein